jgi:hypothetical protein
MAFFVDMNEIEDLPENQIIATPYSDFLQNSRKEPEAKDGAIEEEKKAEQPEDEETSAENDVVEGQESRNTMALDAPDSPIDTGALDSAVETDNDAVPTDLAPVQVEPLSQAYESDTQGSSLPDFVTAAQLALEMAQSYGGILMPFPTTEEVAQLASEANAAGLRPGEQLVLRSFCTFLFLRAVSLRV